LPLYGCVSGVIAEHRRAGDGCQRPLVPRSCWQPRLTPSVRLRGRLRRRKEEPWGPAS